MKTVFLCFILFIVLVKVRAQEPESIIEVPVQKQLLNIEEESRQLQRMLLLNEGQYVKVYEINKERRQNLEEVKTMYSHEPEKRDLKIEEIEKQYDAEFAKVFTKRQLSEYLELHGRGENTAIKQSQQEGPSFDNQIHAIIDKALTPVPDSSQLAAGVSLNTDTLSVIQKVPNENFSNSQIIDSNQNMPGLSGEKIIPLWQEEDDMSLGQQNNFKIKNDSQRERLKIATPLRGGADEQLGK